ncbi:MFS transporter [Pseudobutyrivibrio ruminis]|uniref:Na+/melibiose symporter n=1 Tax=Pseudobutyrivibrio ruminis DSM 9787 TaxID=1123011 RepID=A0A285S9J1_9FIRM|nr:MFS transporter [Pseudobutyrivibrio ruminis]SOC01783.1 Na+/melibiose symporter [Pseudobutyrivibrio ruminis DSM 9787]
MKLDVKKTVQMGFAFLSICAFWQMYNALIPLVLTGTFHLNETISGVIMAMDNVLALFLLPMFGAISDKCKSKMGKRKPFILFGTIAAVILMMLLPIVDNSYFANPTIEKEILFIGILGALLVAMGTYRSPAVALMADCTIKPFRSRANAIINLMGAIGGIIYLGVAAVLYPASKIKDLEHVNYILVFAVVAGIMLVSLCIVMITVDEVALNKQVENYELLHPEEVFTIEDESGNEVLPTEVKRSLVFLLISVALWFIAYNGMETWFTTYAVRMWDMALGDASLCLLVATAGAIVFFIPSGIVASKIGRKKTILLGIVILGGSFFAGFIFTLIHPSFSPLLYVLFACVGIGWAFINVNSLPMVVEMCKGSDIGKFTGYYYTFSMAAQIVTPIVAGWLLLHVGYITLFPYATVFAIMAFITMMFVKHGDGNVEAKRGLEAFEDMD